VAISQIKLENSCGFIELLPGKKYKKKGDPAVHEGCGLLRTVKHNLQKKQWLLNYWRT
jgi:hypothetical protein